MNDILTNHIIHTLEQNTYHINPTNTPTNYIHAHNQNTNINIQLEKDHTTINWTSSNTPTPLYHTTKIHNADPNYQTKLQQTLQTINK